MRQLSINHHFSTTNSNDFVLHFVSSLPLATHVFVGVNVFFFYFIFFIFFLFWRAVREIAITKRNYNEVQIYRALP